jgi:hypothetical protein
LSAISGKVAGVNITNTSGSPGSGTRVVIRGGSSVQGNNQAQQIIQLNAFLPGIYIFSARSGSQVFTKKILLTER